MQTVYVKAKDHPELLALVRAVDPTYRKREIGVSVEAEVSLYGTYWSGGSIRRYAAVNLETMQVGQAPQYDPPQFGGPQTTPVATIPPGAAIVCTGIFDGKTATARVTIGPANAPKWLQAPV